MPHSLDAIANRVRMADPNLLHLSLEADLLHTLLLQSEWPPEWHHVTRFNPLDRLESAISLIERFFPGWDFGVQYRFDDKTDEKYASAVLSTPNGSTVYSEEVRGGCIAMPKATCLVLLRGLKDQLSHAA
ncbi:hypothetical protein CcrColossus_gp316 [Caulobacter phage CcrColossus]|uniref:Uncharacterized protein n=1 Tax=Caulobacter phage CcrColossus TaxID=1211640 RepID=K4JSS3_9CAUD|nr:hypothetical protein CcrColossus_gp316 [Caulobacter phage CcrColossus]AFU88186.1 hypothetical protein CcrColossus_gp316 [Caulobacter phage CcrColossus]